MTDNSYSLVMTNNSIYLSMTDNIYYLVMTDNIYYRYLVMTNNSNYGCQGISGRAAAITASIALACCMLQGWQRGVGRPGPPDAGRILHILKGLYRLETRSRAADADEREQPGSTRPLADEGVTASAKRSA
jgi:hypothetical protein